MNLGKRSGRNNEPDLNVTSLIDVVLLLLIFFMVSTTFVDDARIHIRLPEASAEPQADAPRPQVEVGVTANGAYRVNGKELLNNSADTLSSAISREAGERRDQAVLIRADASATHQSVVTAMDVVGRLGFKAINIATVNQPAGAAKP